MKLASGGPKRGRAILAFTGFFKGRLAIMRERNWALISVPTCGSLPAELHTSAEIEHRTHAENVSVFVIRIPRERIGGGELPF